MPNPVPFNFAPGTVISSAQVNSNNYALATNLNATIASLNGCAWIPSAALGSITILGTNLTAALGTCSANSGTGVGLTLGFSSSPTFTGLTTTNGAVINGAAIAGGTLISATGQQLNLVASTGSVIVNYNSGTTTGLAVYNGGTSPGPFIAGLITGTAIQSTKDGVNLGYVPATYTVTGTSIASTVHMITGSCSTSTTTCLINFSGAAVFTGSNTYACAHSIAAGSQPVSYIVNNTGAQIGVVFTATGTNVGYVACTGT